MWARKVSRLGAPAGQCAGRLLICAALAIVCACGGEVGAGADAAGSGDAPAFGPVGADGSAGEGGAGAPNFGPQVPATAGAGGDGAPPPSAEPAPPVAPPPPPPPIALSPPPGTFTDAFVLELAAIDPAARIHYTLDGSLPTDTAPLYTAPIAIDSTVHVRALSTGGTTPERLVNGLYVHLGADATSFTSDLPLVVVHMLGADAPRPDEYDYQAAGMLVLAPTASRTALLGPAQSDARMGIKVRGRSTREDPKRSYSIELWLGADDDGVGQPLLGMPSEPDWSLYAPYSWDRALIRNAVVYALSNDLGRYAARTRFVELFLVESNASLRMGDYQGLYVLMERIKRDPARVPVETLSPLDVTSPAVSGGYIFKVDDPGPGEQGFEAAGLRFAHVYPSEAKIAPEQLGYLTQHLAEVAAAARSPDGRHPQTGVHYRDLIDVGSFVDHHLINLFTKNPDALRLSSYFHKYRAGALNAGPVWDFDRSMGSYDGRDADPAGWDAGGDGTPMFDYPLWADLFDAPEFRQAYVARMAQVLQNELSVDRVHAHVREMAAQVAEAAGRNAERWPDARPRGGDPQNEIDDLQAWTAARVQWLTDNVDDLP